MKNILDACCGSRMMWFDKENPAALFMDIRNESYTLCDNRALNIKPDIIADFMNMPFEDGSFKLVVFDPPHLRKAGEQSWLRKKYGILSDDWQQDIKKGFEECFRVLEPSGLLIFKWNEDQIKIKDIISLSPIKPLFGHTTGRHGKTHWVTFMKP